MIYTENKKEVRVQLTVFRDGLQSLFGGKARVNDVLPAMKMAADAGVKHMEFGGGARFQAPMFYVGEDPFTYRDIGERVSAVSKSLSLMGIGNGDRVAILSENSPNWV